MRPLGSQIIVEFINCGKKYLVNKVLLQKMLKEAIKSCGINLISIDGNQFNPFGATVISIIGESHVAIHTYPEARHASLDIFTCGSASRSIDKLLKVLKSKFKPKTVRTLKLLRGNPIEVTEKDWMTSFSSSGCGFEVRYHVVKKILSKRSKYQQIDIIENENFGRMLFLDRDVQISETDYRIYSWQLIAPFLELGKSLEKVAILGGGDGGVLSELLKYNPKKVVLIDIDEEVINASKKYLKKISNGSFNDPRVEVVIADVKDYLAKKHNFDGIIYDLTMHPEALSNMERIDFLKKVFSRIRKNLKKEGLVTFQCGSEADKITQQVLNRLFPKYFKNISFRKIFIPSFCENWIFASAEPK